MVGYQEDWGRNLMNYSDEIRNEWWIINDELFMSCWISMLNNVILNLFQDLSIISVSRWDDSILNSKF